MSAKTTYYSEYKIKYKTLHRSDTFLKKERKGEKIKLYEQVRTAFNDWAYSMSLLKMNQN